MLVLRLSSLGDIVLTAPVYRNIKAHWPDARICVLVKPQFTAVLRGTPGVDEVIPFRGLSACLREIRRRRFTHLLDLHATLRTLLIRVFAGIPAVSVYKKNALARRLYVAFRWSSPVLAKHTLERYLESLKPWGIPIRHRELALGDYRSTKPGAAPVRAQEGLKVLLAQTSFLGDTLLTLPLARRVKEALPGCRLSVLTRPETASVFERSPWVDEVILDDKRGRHSGIGGIRRLAADLGRRGFEIAFVAHRSFRSALLMWLTGIPRRIGFSSSAGSFLFHETVFFPWGMPEVERNLALLLPLNPGLRPEGKDALYLTAGDAAASVAARLAAGGVGPDDTLVGIHPGSVWPTKRWFPERFAALAARLARERGARIVLIGGPQDRPLAAEIARRSGVQALNWAGETTLPELMDLIAKLSLLVTNDSGPMHIAAANGVGTLAIFGPTTRELGFTPYGKGHRVVEAELACRPCGLHGSRTCPEGHFLCMGLITVSRVFDEASAMLAERDGAAAGEGAR